MLRRFTHLKRYFSKNHDVKSTEVDKNSIKRKIKQKNDRQKDLEITNYEIGQPNPYYSKENPNPTKNIFEFNEPLLEPLANYLQIYGLGNGYFSVNDVWYPGSIFVYQNQCFLWDVENSDEKHTLDILDVIKPAPQYIIIGTGKDKKDIPQSVYQRFLDQKINVDIVPSFEACSTFNVCNEDGIQVAAFIIPANL